MTSEAVVNTSRAVVNTSRAVVNTSIAIVTASEARQSIVPIQGLSKNENSRNSKMDCRASLAVTE